jgi:transient-receptor-potential-like protein
VLAKRMKIWERRLMKDFQVAPVEIAENPEQPAAPVEENPLDRFRRISKQVASQSTSAKWSEVIRSATIEANSQIGRCRNRDSFRNQQNLLKAMEQAKKLIERSPMPQSPNHSEYSIVDQTNETLVQLLKNISEEINEFSPQGTLCIPTPKNRSVTPLNTLNVQLQSLINSKSASPNLTKEKSKSRATSPRPPILDLRKPSNSNERVFSPPPVKENPQVPKSPSPPKSPTSAKSRPNTPGSVKSESPKSPSKFELSKSPLSKPININKARSPTPEGSKSLDETKSIDSLKCATSPVSPKSPIHASKPVHGILKTPSVEITLDGETSVAVEAQEIVCDPPKPLISFSPDGEKESKPQSPPPVAPTSPTKVIKRKAPVPTADISISRPTAPKVSINQGMIPPPPKKEEVKHQVQIPIVSTTPATPLPTQKLLSDDKIAPENITTGKPEAQQQMEQPKFELDKKNMAVATSVDTIPYSSTEKLVTSNDPSLEANKAASSPPMSLRPVNKIEDVKTIKRQMKTGWL